MMIIDSGYVLGHPVQDIMAIVRPQNLLLFSSKTV